jgi:hypothetical protein
MLCCVGCVILSEWYAVSWREIHYAQSRLFTMSRHGRLFLPAYSQKLQWLAVMLLLAAGATYL